jgi:RNA polymerase sigma factor (sigma-70 family)
VSSQDPSKKVKFPTYAGKIIFNEILMGLRKSDVNRKKSSKTKMYLKITDELTNELQRQPTHQEICDRMTEKGIKLDGKSLARIHDDLAGEVYLDAPVSDEVEETFGNVIQDNGKNVADIVIENDENEKLYRLLEQLPEKERKVILMRFGLISRTEMDHKTIGKKMQISRAYVSRIEKRALKLLQMLSEGKKIPETPLEKLLEKIEISEEEFKVRYLKLSNRERKVIELRYGLNDNNPRTLEETGKILNTSIQTVSDIQKIALDQIKTNLYPDRKNSPPLEKLLDELLLGFNELKLRLAKLSDIERKVFELHCGVPLTIKEIAEIMGKTPKEISIIRDQALKQIEIDKFKEIKPKSIKKPETPLGKLLEKSAIGFKELKSRLPKLPDTERQVIELYYGIPLTIKEIAKIIGKTPEITYIIRKQAFDQIRTNSYKSQAPFKRLLEKIGISEEEFRIRHSKLTDREKQIIELRYGLNDNNPKTIEETAKILNISVQNVSRIQKIALDQIKTNKFKQIKPKKKFQTPLEKFLEKAKISEEEFRDRYLNLNYRVRRIIELRFGLNDNNPLTLEETAKIVKMSAANVSRIQRIALDQIKTDEFEQIKFRIRSDKKPKIPNVNRIQKTVSDQIKTNKFEDTTEKYKNKLLIELNLLENPKAQELLDESLEYLYNKERTIIKLFYALEGKHHSVKEISEIKDIKTKIVEKIRKDSIKKMLHYLREVKFL